MENVIKIDIEKKLHSANGTINLKIESDINIGELIVLFGNSGAGKTTLLRMFSGLTTPDKGKIIVDNKTWFDSEKKINLPPQQRNIGYMFQDYALFPNMTVFQNITFGQTKKDINYAYELIEKFGLSEFIKKKPEKLSGGQKQRVALARALARKPDILLLDEPLSALDSKTRNSLQDEIIKAHNFSKITTLLVSHDLSEVFKLANMVIRIEDGKITASGTPDELFIDTSISGKVQITGNLVKIDKRDTFYLLTVITGMNQVIKVTAFENDIKNLNIGDLVVVFTKAFNPIIMKIKQ